MIPIVLIDDHGGMQFNRRRQSRDRLACADILRLCAGAPLPFLRYFSVLFLFFSRPRLTV